MGLVISALIAERLVDVHDVAEKKVFTALKFKKRLTVLQYSSLCFLNFALQ